MRVYLFSDLDDSLFQTLRKIRLEENAAEFEQYKTVDWLRGKPLCFMSPQQEALLHLFEHGMVIPVTARNAEAFQRVKIPFSHGAILNYGATIFTADGKEDMVWKGSVLAKLEKFQEELEDILHNITAFADSHNLAVRSRIIGVDGCKFYVVIKNIVPENDFLAQLHEKRDSFVRKSEDWFVHFNENNLAFIPACLDKAHAVEYFIKTYIAPLGSDFLTLGLGDSLVDMNFMRTCHYALVPSQSQIQRVRFHG